MSLAVTLAHSFGSFRLDAAFEAPAGLTVITGRSGSGKSSLINMISGIIKPDSGLMRLNGEPLFDLSAGVWPAVHRRRIGYIFQEGRLFPRLSVAGNLDYGARLAPKEARRSDRDRIIEMLGIGPLLTRRPGTLSGGEKQRVAIGRALLSAPRLLLADEPLASLDEARKAEILPLFEQLRDEFDLPILYVSHAPAEVARLATSVVVMREGRVAGCGPVADVLSDPAIAAVMGVREAGALVIGRVLDHAADGLMSVTISGGTLHLPGIAARQGALLRIRIEAQDVMLALKPPEAISSLNVLPAVVEALHEGQGPGCLVRLRVGEDALLSRITRRSADALKLTPGTACHTVVKSVSVAPQDIG